MADHDILIEGEIAGESVSLPLMLYEDAKHPKGVGTVWTPSSAGLTDQVWADFRNGFGYSQPGIVADGYAYALGADPTSPGLVTSAGLVTEIDLSALSNIGHCTDSFVLANGHLYFLVGRTMIKVASGTGSLSTVGDAGVGQTFITATTAKHSTTEYAWIGASADFYRFDGTNTPTAAGFTRSRMATVYWATTDGVSVQRLVATGGSGGDFVVQHCPLTSDPLTSGNWSAAITVGPGNHAVGWIAGAGRHVYLATSGGLYDIDDLGQTINLTPYVEYDPYNGLGAVYSDGSVLVALADGVDAVDISEAGRRQETFNWALPGAAVGIPNETPLYGRITAFSRQHDRGWVPAALWNGTDSYIIYGKRRARIGLPGPGDWVWHGSLTPAFEDQQVTHLSVRATGIGASRSRRLWIATRPSDLTTVSTRLYWQSLPVASSGLQDLDQSLAHRVGTSWSIYLTPWGGPRRKVATHAKLDARDLSASSTLALAVGVDGGAMGSTLRTMTDVDDAEIPLADEDIEGKEIAPLVTGAGTTTAPSVLRSLTLSGAVDPEASELLEFDAWMVRAQRLGHGGATASATPELDYDDLARMQSRKVTVTLPDESVVTGVMETLPSSRQMYHPDASRTGTRNWGRRVTVRVLLVETAARFGTSRYSLGRYG